MVKRERVIEVRTSEGERKQMGSFPLHPQKKRGRKKAIVCEMKKRVCACER